MSTNLSRLTPVLALLALACGGGGGGEQLSPPPPPTPKLKPAITSVVLTTDKTFLFTATPAALSDFVAHVYDSTGVEVPKSDLHFTADVLGDWSVRNDSIFPPSTEQRHPVTVRASYRVPTLSGSLLPAPAGLAPSYSQAGSSTPILTIDVILDLRLHRFRVIDFKCTETAQHQYSGFVDSLDANGNIVKEIRVDSIYYSGMMVDSVGSSASAVHMFGAQPPYTSMYFGGATYALFLENGTTQTSTLSVEMAPFLTGQMPDSVTLSGDLLIRTSPLGSPLTYSGANIGPRGSPSNPAGWEGMSLCGSEWAVREPLIIQEF